MLDFQAAASRIIAQVQKGERMVLTYRGRPVLRLEPLHEAEVADDDPFYDLAHHADARGTSLTNEQMDEAIYGS